MVFDSADIGLTPIATGPFYTYLLPPAQEFIEEAVDGFTTLTLADPQDKSAVEIVNDGGEFAALEVGDLIDPHRHQAPDLMPITHPIDNPVQQIRARRWCPTQDLSSGLPGHDMAQESR